MKTSRLSIGLCAAALALLAVSCNRTVAPQTAEGKVVDATMNNVMLVTKTGDTLNVSTMDADPAKVEGVLLGEQIRVTYMPEKIESGEVLKATELVVTRHVPAFFISGTWVEPNPIDPAKKQGMTLKEDLTASSVGMETLLYTGWALNGEVLRLHYKSVGNRQTIEGTDTLKIMRIDADTMILERPDGKLWRLTRDK